MENKDIKKESAKKASAKKPEVFVKDGSASGGKVGDNVRVVNKKEAVKKSIKEKKVVAEVKASGRYVRIAPRKIRLVIDQLRGLEVDQAVASLKFMNKNAALTVAKILNSAIANAENNFQLDKKDLFIKTLTVNDGPTLKRFKPRAHGRSFQIRKRTSHVDLILGVKEGAKLKTVSKKITKKEDIKIVKPQEVKPGGKDSSKGPDRSNSQKGSDGKGFMKGMFQRKTG